MKKWMILCLTLVTAVGFLACDTKSTAAPTTDTPAKTVGTTPDGSGKTKDGKPAEEGRDTDPKVAQVDDAPKGDIYPGVPVQLLKPEDRKTFVRVMKAQLCPCEGVLDSMDACLRDSKQQCDLAVSSAIEGINAVGRGMSERDTLDAVASYIAAANKVNTFKLDDTPVLGKRDAPVVVVEFADFECPFCSRARELVKQARKDHGDNVAIAFKQFPLSMHQHASLASAASLAAHNQGKFWEMYDLLFDNQRELSEAKILELAQALGLNMQTFKADYKAAKTVKQIERDKQEGLDARVNSTPSFFINGKKYIGDVEPAAFSKAIGAELKKVQKK